jgi:hypothetical protein
MRFRAADLRRHGWTPPQTLQIPDWCGCSTEYLPVEEGDGWWHLVPFWEPAQTPNPLRRWEPAVPSRWSEKRTCPYRALPPHIQWSWSRVIHGEQRLGRVFELPAPQMGYSDAVRKTAGSAALTAV